MSFWKPGFYTDPAETLMTAVLLTKPCSVHFVVGIVRLEPETEGWGLLGMRRQKALETKMPVFYSFHSSAPTISYEDMSPSPADAKGYSA